MIVSALEDAAHIHGAARPDTLWRYLVAHVTLRAMLNAFDASVVFRKLHEHQRANALRTAQLLCTDLRWRRVTASLIADIEQTGILDDSALDELADGFLWQDELGWPVPEQWLRDGTVRARGKKPKPGGLDVVIERQIPPPLRRWAAGRVVAREPDQAPGILGRIEPLDARAGDAVMAGILDATGVLVPEARGALIELGCSWPSGSVRLRALKLLAEIDQSAAVQRAVDDPSATVRRWGQRLPTRLDHQDRSNRTHAAGPIPRQPVTEPQPSLFD